MIADLNGPLFPNVGSGNTLSYNSVDTSLWFFWALQQYAEFSKNKKQIWLEYGRKMKLILEGYRKGTLFNIKMLENGLLYSGEPGKALTWMDAIVHGKPVTPRIGLAIEVNALWYNAIMFSLEVAKLADDTVFVDKWTKIAEHIPLAFTDTFGMKKKASLPIMSTVNIKIGR